MPNSELRLRENVWVGDPLLDSAFVIGGRPMSNGDWEAGRVVCSWYDYDEGEPPSPEDTRRIEVAWNCHAELVAAVTDLLGGLDEYWVTLEEGMQIVDDARVVLAKAQEGQVARGDAGDAEGEG